MALLGHYGLSDWVEFDAKVVRGLAYYSGTVFEGFDRAGELRAICGGGRYDRIVGMFGAGAAPIPAVGFGLGDAVVVELLKSKQRLPGFATPNSDVLLHLEHETLRPRAIRLASALRACGVSVDLALEESRSTKSAFRRADKLGAQYMLLLTVAGDALGGAVLKDLRSNTQQRTLSYEDVIRVVSAGD